MIGRDGSCRDNEELLEVGNREGELLEVGMHLGRYRPEELLDEELLEVGNREVLLWADGHWHAVEGSTVHVLFAASLIGFLSFVSFHNVLRIQLSGDEEQY